MKFIELKTIKARELAEAVKLQYGVDIDIALTMWDDIFKPSMENFYRPLYYNTDVIVENRENMELAPNCEIYKMRDLVYTMLADSVPENQCILVDVSW
jgi:hypothetical protein